MTFQHRKPPNFRPTPFTIQRLKRCHPNAGVIAIIIRELYQGQMIVPATPEVNHTRLQHILQCMNGALNLPISMRMKSSTKLYVRAKVFVKRSREI